MNIRRISTIFRKDVRDAIRDSRVLVALVLPLGIGIFYNYAFDDDDAIIKANVAYSSPDSTTLPADITAIVGDSAEIRFAEFETEQEVRDSVESEDADLGLIIPAGFDAAIKQGALPPLEVVLGPESSTGADYVISAIEPALRLMSGAPPPADITVTSTADPDESVSVIDQLGVRLWSVILAIVVMVAMIGLLAVPIILAEENEKKTLDALVLIASYREVVVAKALVGVFYLSIMTPLLLLLTGIRPERVPLFVGALLALGTTLIGFGLLMAGVFKNANQLNTWAGIFLAPVIAPAAMIGLPLPDLISAIAAAFPTGAATKLLMNSLSTEILFERDILNFAIILAWGAAAYLLLLWQLSRRQA